MRLFFRLNFCQKLLCCFRFSQIIADQFFELIEDTKLFRMGMIDVRVIPYLSEKDYLFYTTGFRMIMK